jgi:hypothetical protein
VGITGEGVFVLIIYFNEKYKETIKMLGLRNGWKKILAAVVREEGGV